MRRVKKKEKWFSITELVAECLTAYKSGRVTESVKDPLLLSLFNSTRRYQPPPQISWAILLMRSTYSTALVKHWNIDINTLLCKHMQGPQGEHSVIHEEVWQSGYIKKNWHFMERPVFAFMIFHRLLLALTVNHWESSHFSMKGQWRKPNNEILPSSQQMTFYLQYKTI